MYTLSAPPTSPPFGPAARPGPPPPTRASPRSRLAPPRGCWGLLATGAWPSTRLWLAAQWSACCTTPTRRSPPVSIRPRTGPPAPRSSMTSATSPIVAAAGPSPAPRPVVIVCVLPRRARLWFPSPRRTSALTATRTGAMVVRSTRPGLSSRTTARSVAACTTLLGLSAAASAAPSPCRTVTTTDRRAPTRTRPRASRGAPARSHPRGRRSATAMRRDRTRSTPRTSTPSTER